MEIEQNDSVVDQLTSAPTNPILNPPEPNTAEKEASSDEIDEKPADKPEEAPIPKGVQKRIDRAVRQKYEAEARSKMLEERLNALEQRQYVQPQNHRSINDSAPTIDKFDSFDDYVAAKAEYIAKKQIETTLSERDERQKTAYEAAERQKTADSWTKRVTQATVEMPDFEDVLSSSEVPMTGPMQQAIMESDIGPRLAYHLASNPEEAVKIAEMSPMGAIRALGRLEERLASQKTEIKTTNAPPPIKTVGTRATVTKDPGKMSDAEYAKWRKSTVA